MPIPALGLQRNPPLLLLSKKKIRFRGDDDQGEGEEDTS